MTYITYRKCFEFKSQFDKSDCLQMLLFPSEVYESCSEMLPFVSMLHENLCEILSNFYPSLHI